MKQTKIAHVSVFRELAPGTRKQLKFEHKASLDNLGAIWTTVAFHGGTCVEPFERQIPRPFRAVFIRNFYAWVQVWKISRQNDYVLLRHKTADPFAFLFAPFIRNRISVHHTKEIEETPLQQRGWKGRLASKLEVLSGGFVVRRSRMILGVTGEIAEYERKVHKANAQAVVYPNGVDTECIPIAADKRVPDELNAVFMCAFFSPWHGLDKIVQSTKCVDLTALPVTPKIHLIGKLSAVQEKEIENDPVCRLVFVRHGLLDQSQYMQIIDRCDIGLGSLALERNNLKEASTLKVRELLAAGIPVYSAHVDASLPSDFPYYNFDPEPGFSEMVRFGLSCKTLERSQVREAATGYIDKKSAMEMLLVKLASLR